MLRTDGCAVVRLRALVARQSARLLFSQYSIANSLSTEDNGQEPSNQDNRSSGATTETRVQLSETEDHITEDDIKAAMGQRHETEISPAKSATSSENEEEDPTGAGTGGIGDFIISSPETNGSARYRRPLFTRHASLTSSALIAASLLVSAPVTRDILFSTEEEEDDISKAKKDVKGQFWERLGTGKVNGGGNRVGNVSASDDDTRRRGRDTKSGKALRNMRKMVSVTSKDNKSRTSQEDLATAVVTGNLLKTEQIVDAFVALYRAEGFKTIMKYM
jgi:hypothetical protein